MDISKLKQDYVDGLSVLDKLESSSNFKVVKFGAEWCSPCVRLKPYFQNSQEENPDIDFYDIDLGDQQNQKNVLLAQNFQVKGIPFVVLLSPENKVVKKAEDTFHFMDEFKELINGKTEPVDVS
jgi:thiol-disulfide isomerase/thioredoxin